MEITDIIIDPEFRDKIPRQTEEEFSGLSADILRDGYVRDPLTVWKEESILLDGHHRWDVITENWELLHDQFRIDYRSFPNRWAAIAWICNNQLHRHNMNELQRAKLIQEEHDATMRAVSNAEGRNQYTKEVVGGQNDHQPKTREIIAKEHGITEAKVKRDVEFGRGLDKADEVVPGFKQEILTGQTKPNRISDIADMRNMSPSQIAEKVEEVRNPSPKVHFPKTDNRGRGRPAELSAIEELDKAHYGVDEVPEYGIADLIEEVRALQDDFIRKYNRIMDIRRDVATDNARELLKVMKEFDAEWKEIKEILK